MPPQGVLTERGGMTSHAAVIARGLGLPCVVGASTIGLNRKDKTHHRRRMVGCFGEGDMITIDGTTGECSGGRGAALLEPSLDDAFRTLLGWADDARDIGVRANADTPCGSPDGARL